eukprot:548742-Prorocentrum_minimum.AAC.1
MPASAPAERREVGQIHGRAGGAGGEFAGAGGEFAGAGGEFAGAGGEFAGVGPRRADSFGDFGGVSVAYLPWGHAPSLNLGIFEWAAFFSDWAGPSRIRVLGYTGRDSPPALAHPVRAAGVGRAAAGAVVPHGRPVLRRRRLLAGPRLVLVRPSVLFLMSQFAPAGGEFAAQ